MNEIINTMNIENKIYEVRGLQVMLDSDLAEMYHVDTKRINEAVKNNPKKFPKRYVLRISDKEYDSLKSKISTSKGGSRKGHSAFTEQGVYMLATILKSSVATEVSLAIMDTFVKMRHYINYNNNLLPNKILLLEDKVDNNTKRINELFDKFDHKAIAKNCIFFKGEYYDDYSLLLDILNKSKNEIIIIDNYLGKEILDVLREINKDIKIIFISNNINKQLIKKYESQYNNVSFIRNKTFHDRFIIIDRVKIYECGSSLKDLGNKCFYIGEINKEYINLIMNEINNENKDQ